MKGLNQPGTQPLLVVGPLGDLRLSVGGIYRDVAFRVGGFRVKGVGLQ